MGRLEPERKQADGSVKTFPGYLISGGAHWNRVLGSFIVLHIIIKNPNGDIGNYFGFLFTYIHVLGTIHTHTHARTAQSSSKLEVQLRRNTLPTSPTHFPKP